MVFFCGFLGVRSFTYKNGRSWTKMCVHVLFTLFHASFTLCFFSGPYPCPCRHTRWQALWLRGILSHPSGPELAERARWSKESGHKLLRLRFSVQTLIFEDWWVVHKCSCPKILSILSSSDDQIPFSGIV